MIQDIKHFDLLGPWLQQPHHDGDKAILRYRSYLEKDGSFDAITPKQFTDMCMTILATGDEGLKNILHPVAKDLMATLKKMLVFLVDGKSVTVTRHDGLFGMAKVIMVITSNAVWVIFQFTSSISRFRCTRLWVFFE